MLGFALHHFTVIGPANVGVNLALPACAAAQRQVAQGTRQLVGGEQVDARARLLGVEINLILVLQREVRDAKLRVPALGQLTVQFELDALAGGTLALMIGLL
ncbi:hypothetical protein D3C80_1537590 [compost metagenome]